MPPSGLLPSTRRPAKFALLLQPDRGPCFAAVVDLSRSPECLGPTWKWPRFTSCRKHCAAVSKKELFRPYGTRSPTITWAACGSLPAARWTRSDRIGPGGITTSDLQWLSISIEGIAPEPAIISIGLTLGAFVSILAEGALAPAAIDRWLFSALATEAYYTLGSLPLTFAALAALGPGDLVVLPELPPICVLRAQRRAHAFRFIDQNWVCLGREVTERYRPALDAIEEQARCLKIILLLKPR